MKAYLILGDFTSDLGYEKCQIKDIEDVYNLLPECLHKVDGIIENQYSIRKFKEFDCDLSNVSDIKESIINELSLLEWENRFGFVVMADKEIENKDKIIVRSVLYVFDSKSNDIKFANKNIDDFISPEFVQYQMNPKI